MTTIIAPLPAAVRTQAASLDILSAAVQDAITQQPRPEELCRTDSERIAYAFWFQRGLQIRSDTARRQAARAATKRQPDAPRF